MVKVKFNYLIFSHIVLTGVILCGCNKSATIQKCNPQQRNVVSLSGAKIFVPEGAADDDFIIKAQVAKNVPEEMKSDVKFASRVYNFECESIKEFKKPLKIFIEFRGDSNVSPAFWNGENWTKVNGIVKGKFVEFETNH